MGRPRPLRWDYERKSQEPPWYEAAFCLHGPGEGVWARVRADSVSVITSLIHSTFDLFTFSDSVLVSANLSPSNSRHSADCCKWGFKFPCSVWSSLAFSYLAVSCLGAVKRTEPDPTAKKPAKLMWTSTSSHHKFWNKTAARPLFPDSCERLAC